MVGLDQCQVKVGYPDLDWQSWEAGAGTDVDEMDTCSPALRKPRRVGQPRCFLEQASGSEQRLAEVAGDDLFRLADSGEVDACIPAEK